MNESAKVNRPGEFSQEPLTSVAREALKEQYGEMKNKFRDVRERAKQYSGEVTHQVEAHPFWAIAGGAVIGFVLGAIISRR